MAIIDDLRYAARLLLKTPFHSFITLFILVLGLTLYIGSHTFAKISIDKPMPFPNGDSYVRLKAIDPQFGQDEWNNVFDLYTYQSLVNTSDNYLTLGAYHRRNSVVSDDAAYPQRFRSATISHNLLVATGIQPTMGRLFSHTESTDAEPIAIISEALWQDYFKSDTNIIGRVTHIDGQAKTIIGVMPNTFKFPFNEDVWLPLTVKSSLQPGEGLPVAMTGILAPGATLNNAEVELDNLYSTLKTEFPNEYKTRNAIVSAFAERNSIINIGFFSLITAYIVLALASVNLTSLLFMRAISRQQELAVRASLGANRWQIAKQVLLESLLLCLAGFGVSLITGMGLLTVMGRYLESSNSPFWYTFNLGYDSITAGFVMTLVIWLGSGLFVAYRTWTTDPNSTLSKASNGAGNIGKNIANKVVVTLEVVLSSFVLVATAGTIVYLDLTNVTDYGVNPNNTAVVKVSFDQLTSEQNLGRLNMVDNFRLQIEALPDVEAVGITTSLPGRSGLLGAYHLEDEVIDKDSEGRRQGSIWISDSYFNSIGIEILTGRHFDSGDTSNTDKVVIITDEFARSLWPTEAPLGKTLLTTINGIDEPLRVAGTVSAKLMQTNSTSGMFSMPSLYRPLSQGTPASLDLVIKHKATINKNNLAQQLRFAAVAIDRRIIVEDFQSLADTFQTSDADRIQLLAQMFSFAALVLAAIGVYAVLARSITERTWEIGVRRALGSNNLKIFLEYGQQGLYFLVAGVVFGGGPVLILIAYSFSQLSTATTTTSPFFIVPVWLGVGLIMALVIGLASYIPTRQAIHMEPGDALRYE